MRAAGEWRWTRRRFKDAVDESLCDSGVGEGSVRFCFVGLGSEDMGADEELTIEEREVTEWRKSRDIDDRARGGGGDRRELGVIEGPVGAALNDLIVMKTCLGGLGGNGETATAKSRVAWIGDREEPGEREWVCSTSVQMYRRSVRTVTISFRRGERDV